LINKVVYSIDFQTFKYTNNFQSNYDKILEILKTITEKENFSHQIREPKLKDIELIAMNLTSEYMSIGSECQLFRMIPDVLLYNIIP